MDRPTCKSCPYAVRVTKWDDEEVAFCHRHAPRPQVVPVEEDRDCVVATALVFFPEMELTEGCGEHPAFPNYIRSLGVPSLNPDRVLTGG